MGVNDFRRHIIFLFAEVEPFRKGIITATSHLKMGRASPLLPALLLSLAAAAARARGPIAKLPDGEAEGVETEVSFEFLGLPFATPPTPANDGRWRPPAPSKPWAGVRDATAFGPSCWQMRSSPIPQDEDCLYLNVFAPKKAAAAANASAAAGRRLLPVMAWFHGGCSTDGTAMSSRWNGSAIIRRNPGVVVVSIAYRLNVFGFGGGDSLRGRDPGRGSTGNYGIQGACVRGPGAALVLRWCCAGAACAGAVLVLSWSVCGPGTD